MRYILVLIAAVILASTAHAQLSVSVSFNVDRQPIWGPTGYDYVEFYYFPDIDVYYYVPQHRYFYFERGQWMGRSSLPRRYRNFDLYTSYKVVVNEPEPYRNDAKYREEYSSYKGRHGQETIRDSRDQKYFVNPKHPEHKKWVKQNKANSHKDKVKGHGNAPAKHSSGDNRNDGDNHRGNGSGRK